MEDVHVFAVELVSQGVLSHAQVELLVQNRVAPRALLDMPSDQYLAKLGTADPAIIARIQHVAGDLLDEGIVLSPRSPPSTAATAKATTTPRLSWLHRIIKSRSSSLKSAASLMTTTHKSVVRSFAEEEYDETAAPSAAGVDEVVFSVSPPPPPPDTNEEAACRPPRRFARRILAEDLDAAALGELMVREGVLQQADGVDALVRANLTLQLAWANLPALAAAAEVPPAAVEFVYDALHRLSSKRLARLLMGRASQVNLSAFYAKCLVRFQVRYGALKHYTGAGAATAWEEIGITSALAQARLQQWVRRTEQAAATAGSPPAAAGRDISQLSVLELAERLLECEVVQEHEAERLVRHGVDFVSLASAAAASSSSWTAYGISNTVTQAKLALYATTQSPALVAALQVLKSRRRATVRADVLEALRGANGNNGQVHANLSTVLAQDAVPIESVELLLQSPGLSIEHCGATSSGQSLLHLACKTATVQPAYVRFLLANKAPVDAQDACQHTPLMLASRAGNADTVRQLLLHGGASAAKENAFGFTALDFAVQYNAPGEVLHALLTLARDADVNHANREFPGQTLLWFAVERNHVENVRALLDAGADYRLANSGSGSLLGFAVQRNGDGAIAHLLLQHAREEGLVHVPNRHGFTPMRLLAQQGHRANPDIARALVRAGARALEKDGANLLQLYKKHYAPPPPPVPAVPVPVADGAAAAPPPPPPPPPPPSASDSAGGRVVARALMGQALIVLLCAERKRTKAPICRLPPELIRLLGGFVA